jgi:hypothetical protein
MLLMATTALIYLAMGMLYLALAVIAARQGF